MDRTALRVCLCRRRACICGRLANSADHHGIVPIRRRRPTDVVGRIVAQQVGDILKQQLVVENIGGAGGMTGPNGSRGDARRVSVLLGTVGTQAYNQTLL